MRVVVDTDVLIDYFRGLEKSKTFIEKIRESHLICYSAITQAELLAGKESESEKARDKIMDFLFNFVMIPVESEIAQIAGQYRRKYDIKLDDALIAATAKKMKADLVSKNNKHFGRIIEIKLLKPY